MAFWEKGKGDIEQHYRSEVGRSSRVSEKVKVNQSGEKNCKKKTVAPRNRAGAERRRRVLVAEGEARRRVESVESDTLLFTVMDSAVHVDSSP